MEATKSQTNTNNKIHPHMFALWLSLGSIIMMFAAFMSAYTVRQSAGNWLEFGMPLPFYISTVVVVLCSLVLHFSYQSYKQGKEKRYKAFLSLGFLLGVVFTLVQVWGWFTMSTNGIDLKGNPSGSFIYVISGVHALHVLGGLVVLLFALFHAFATPFEVSDKRNIRFKLTLTYWHFVDILWVYLFLFFLLQK